jgi:hypothetical protein
MMTEENDLVGTWRLVDWTFCVDGSRERRPFGGNATGLLTYTPDGRMWAALMRKDRPDVPTRTLSAASADLRAAVAAGYLNYAGRYTVEEAHVDHHVEISLLPNWVGGVQRRDISWIEDGSNGPDLLLSTPETRTDSGRMTVERLRWRRIGEDG